MIASWNLDDHTLALWRRFVAENESKVLPRRRYELNVRRKGIDLSERNIWRVLVGCQVTTQQRSGPNSAVSRFLKSESPALDMRRCREAKNLAKFLERELTVASLRRGPTIANNLSRIWRHLEEGEWTVLLSQLETLRSYPTSQKEKAVVAYMLGGKFPGLGQKQSRNFIQWLGLSRYEVPLDSRVLKKMREFGATFVPSGTALTDEVVYSFVQNCLQQVARELDIYPCMLDACIFASFDVADDTESADEA